MATTTDKISYGTSTAITCTLTALATSATAGRVATVVDNTSNFFDDALVTIQISTGSSAPKAGAAAYVYFSGSEDGTNMDSDDTAITNATTDAAYTVNAASNLKGPGVIAMPTASKTYTKTFSVASFFGGLMPRFWTFVVVADIYSSGNTGSADGSSYTGITYTNS